MTHARIFLVILLAAFSGPILAEAVPTGTLEGFREQAQVDKKHVVTANLDLTDEEARKFWPVYEAYQEELKKLNRRTGQVIFDYAEAVRGNTLTDAQALVLIQESIAVEKAEAKLKSDFVPKLAKVLPARKAIRYIQMESKLRAAVRAELAEKIPLVE